MVTISGGPSDEGSIAAEKIKVSKEALVSKEDMGDDILGEEEWNVLSSSE